MRILLRVVLFGLSSVALVQAQSLGTAGTIVGTVTDPGSATVPNASVSIRNVITGYSQTTTTSADGTFRISNIPPNPYHFEISAPGFALYSSDIQVRSSVPLSLRTSLQLAGSATSVTVEAAGADLLENVPYAHNDVNQAQYSKLPALSPGSQLSDAITLTAPGVVADSNGFFHPLGDHAQTTFSIDGQPISDQQSKQFSTQLPLNAIQSMELTTGGPNAEFGDKTSLIVNAVTKSGLDQRPFGSLSLQYGSFGTLVEETTLGFGNAKIGNFLSANVTRSGRFLDTPEFRPVHAIGNNYTIFDHFDYRPGSRDNFHLNLFQARNWFQVPNTYDQPDQDQRQKTLTYNIAPGYQRTISSSTLFTINPFFRQDQVNYYRSRDIFADSPVSPQQTRRLTNWGVRADVSHVSGIHNLKVGTQIMQTRLGEQFTLGITDPDFEFTPGLVPFDLTRGGSLFRFSGSTNINQYAFYAQDTITWGNWSFTPGLRVDHYDGLVTETGVQPRIGVSYRVESTGTVLRGSYARTFETPYNENLVLSSATGSGGLAENVFGGFGAAPVRPGRRNQFNIGMQQAIYKYILLDGDYFWKFTDNAFDFGTLLNTPIYFPISWNKSKLDGVSFRVSTVNIRGFQAAVTMGHSRSRFFGPSVGGLIFNSPLETSVFRIDHDQAFQQTTHLRYQRSNDGPWFAFTWRYDSGLVAGAVPDLESALGLTGAEQAAIGFFCGDQRGSRNSPISECTSSNYGTTRFRIPAPGTEDADHNPPRVSPRNIFNIGIGDDNIFRRDRLKLFARATVENLTNKVALYNFLSTFSGTHFVTPRAFRGEIGFTF
ncbi:MAG: TonB-dependent receptor [Bryobacteraceae bacterium]|nr:TonB-dependent receptor [Bryobacteraceae bacterium]